MSCLDTESGVIYLGPEIPGGFEEILPSQAGLGAYALIKLDTDQVTGLFWIPWISLSEFAKCTEQSFRWIKESK